MKEEQKRGKIVGNSTYIKIYSWRNDTNILDTNSNLSFGDPSFQNFSSLSS